MATETAGPRIGIALGSGAARGWAHIGILSALEKEGVVPEIVCGTSIGSLVGGLYCAGKLPELKDWVGNLTRRDVISLLDFTVAGGGMLGGKRLMDLYREHLGEITIEDLPKSYAAVATDLMVGTEVWMQSGPLLDAIRASISIPGMFTPIMHEGRWLVDGALVNPVPVSLCRALGADIVIAVDLNSGTLPVYRNRVHGRAEAERAVVREKQGSLPFDWAKRSEGRAEEKEQTTPPNMRTVVATALDIMQDRISRSRLAGDPPDLLLSPRVSHLPLLEFAGGKATIDEGYDEVRRMMPALAHLLGM